MILAPGDIVAVRGRGWLADGIIKAEYGDGMPPYNAVSHVGLLVAGDPIPVVIEALNQVVTDPLDVTLAGCARAFVLHDKSLNENQRRAIIAKACTFSAKSYGYLDLFAQWLDANTGTTWWTDRMSGYLGHWPICSFVVAEAYSAVGLDFGVDNASCKPSDIMEFATKHPEIYDVTAIKR